MTAIGPAGGGPRLREGGPRERTTAIGCGVVGRGSLVELLVIMQEEGLDH